MAGAVEPDAKTTEGSRSCQFIELCWFPTTNAPICTETHKLDLYVNVFSSSYVQIFKEALLLTAL